MSVDAETLEKQLEAMKLKLKKWGEPEKDAETRWQAAQGTPKTLHQAIFNATVECVGKDFDFATDDPTDIYEKHVKDYLAQKFQLYMLGDGSLIDTTAQAIWEKVMNIKS